MPLAPVLSCFTIEPLLTAKKEGATVVRVSLDLSLTETAVTLSDEGAYLTGGQPLPWSAFDEIADTDNACFLIENVYMNAAAVRLDGGIRMAPR